METRVRSWNELLEQLYAESWQARIGRFRATYAFCGMSDAAYTLKTSLMRLGGPYAELEGHLLRNFRKYARYDTAQGDAVWNWLALAQHHGLPTRLLDWTYSPFVALHFVTERLECFDVDGVVWCVDYVQAQQEVPHPLRTILQQESADVFTAEMLSHAAGSLSEYEQLSDEPFVAFLEPPSLDDRIVNQFALFSLMSSARVRLDQWLEGRPELYRRIVIPAELKWEVRDKLDQANITERVLYPGLDGLSRWLRRYYLPRAEAEAAARLDEDADRV